MTTMTSRAISFVFAHAPERQSRPRRSITRKTFSTGAVRRSAANASFVTAFATRTSPLAAVRVVVDRDLLFLGSEACRLVVHEEAHLRERGVEIDGGAHDDFEA